MNGLNSDESLALVKVHINMAKLSGIKGLAKLILSKNGVNINQLMGYLHYFDFSDKLIIYFIYYLRIYIFRLI